MEEKLGLDEVLLKKFNRLADAWPEHRRDLTHMIYFSLSIIMLTFFNLRMLDAVVRSPVVKVIDVFGLLLLFIVAIWSNYERTQGDNIQQMMRRVNAGEYDPDDTELMAKLQEAAKYSEIAEREYPFVLMMIGVGIFTLNLIAYFVYGPVPG